MNIAKVIGTVVSTQKETTLESLKFLLVQNVSIDGMLEPGLPLVAIDAVGAGMGEIIMYASGSSARQTLVTKDRPVDATIMGIIDEITVDGKIRFRKND